MLRFSFNSNRIETWGIFPQTPPTMKYKDQDLRNKDLSLRSERSVGKQSQ
ncbi:MAG: hypothetical protein ACFB02_10285 [Mastigocoleus sp.]